MDASHESLAKPGYVGGGFRIAPFEEGVVSGSIFTSKDEAGLRTDLASAGVLPLITALSVLPSNMGRGFHVEFKAGVTTGQVSPALKDMTCRAPRG